MFERYTERARRVIFFARYEASQLGSPYIETEHVLLGLLREDKVLANRFLRSQASMESIRKQIEARRTMGEKVSTSVDLPLSNESKRVLAYAAEEAEKLSNNQIGTEHLLLGVLREENCFAAAILHERGLRHASVLEELSRNRHSPEKQVVNRPSVFSHCVRDLTRAAMDGQLDPLIGRDHELSSVVEILCSRARNNPVLVGEPGVGKTAIVYGLAQLIADGTAPRFLAGKRILAIDLGSAVAGWRRGGQFEARFSAALRDLTEPRNTIILVDDVGAFGGPGEESGDASNFLKAVVSHDQIRCIWEATGPGYEDTLRKIGWLGRVSRAVNVQPLNLTDAERVLHGLKDRYEKYHGVTYKDEALTYAARYAIRYMPNRCLPASAIDILDAAGTRVKLQHADLPKEAAEIKKRIRFISHRMEAAIANHEFEKARFYSDEEHKERDNLRALYEKHHIDESAVGVVSREEIERVVSQLTGISVDSIRRDAADAQDHPDRQ
jgi:ATP-dependent Clp protease ATP-binding subunit ClpC